MSADLRPVVFIHGLWLHATQLGPLGRAVPQAGYAPVAPGWPGEPPPSQAAREQPRGRRRPSASTTSPSTSPRSSRSCTGRPSSIGHSFGGLIAEKLLGQGVGAAAVAIDPAQIKGVLPLPLAAAARRLPGARQPGEQAPGGLADGQAVPLRLRQRGDRGGVRRAVRAVDDPRHRQARCSRRPPPTSSCTREAKVDTDNEHRGPLLLISGSEDHTVPDVVTRSTLKQYRTPTAVTELSQFEGAGTP